MGTNRLGEKEAIKVASRMFREWLSERGTDGSSDMEAAIRQVRALLQSDGFARFPLIKSDGSVHNDQVIRDQAGFRRRDPRTGELEYWIPTEIFRSEVCNGFSTQLVAKELCARGYLRRTEPHLTIKVRLPGLKNPIRVYCVSERILEGDKR